MSKLGIFMNPRSVIDRNCVYFAEYDEESFSAILHEKGIWQRDQYWILEWAIFDLTSRGEIREDMYAPVFRIFSLAIGAISSHLDQNDLFEIVNLDRQEIYEFRDRIRIIFEGFFFGRIPERVMFEEVNPLLPKGKDAFL
ncbi:immunity 41 family protein [Paraburkholderia bryophila]|uniref:Imm41 family immunity protein n=1 Tax=Paraburkholderia bryophila TaxID=420952 RepID=UPI00234AFAE1|nr:Imm41 family immunity protein [Paraburkholderia bryophila]WCM22947.1 immunity 41 family protein [Paraburkholderia bryophila]